MLNKDDYHAYKSTSTNSSRSGNSSSCGGKFVLVILAILFIYFISQGASWDAIDSLLGIGFLVFLFVNWITK